MSDLRMKEKNIEITVEDWELGKISILEKW